MRILFAADVDPDPDSGAAGTEWQTIQALRQLGHQVDEIWAADLGRRIKHGNLHYLLELPHAYRRVIGERSRKVDYDVIHANQGHCYLAARAHHHAKRRGVFVCRSHGLDDRMEQVLKPWRRQLGMRTHNGIKSMIGGTIDGLLHRHDSAAYRAADGIIVSSGGDAAYLRDSMAVPAAHVACIAQAPAAAFVTSDAPGMDPSRLRCILHVGGFAYWKGVHAVAAVANTLLSQDGIGQMTWVCRAGEHEKVRDLLTPGARDRIDLRGWMSQEELVSTYDRHGIFLCPSLFDGFGKVFLEAMARGLCVIGTNTGGMPDVIRNGENGYLVGFHAPDEIVQRINMLWADEGRASKVSSAAAKTARTYSWPRVARETVAFYERLLESRTAAVKH